MFIDVYALQQMCEMWCLKLQWESTKTPKSRHSFTLGNCTYNNKLYRLSNISVRQDATLVFSNLELPFSSPPHKQVEVKKKVVFI